jgi:hypothetical protein
VVVIFAYQLETYVRMLFLYMLPYCFNVNFVVRNILLFSRVCLILVTIVRVAELFVKVRFSSFVKMLPFSLLLLQVYRMLLAVDSGNLHSFSGRSLDDINIDGTIFL